MGTKPVELGELLKEFADYVSSADIVAAKVLAKISGTITKKRVDMGMTQKEFATFMNVSQSMVSKWESEDYNYSIETLAKICDKLNLQLEIEMKSNISQYVNLVKLYKGQKKENQWSRNQSLPTLIGKGTYPKVEAV